MRFYNFRSIFINVIVPNYRTRASSLMKKEKGTYEKGIKDGLWNEWYEDGQKKSEANYKDGKIISIKRWNEDGSFIDTKKMVLLK